MSRTKELNYFITELGWNRGEVWYRSKFRGDAKVYGESSPLYSNCIQHKGVPKRMHATVPEAKLIYVVRDPVERIISQFVHATALRLETRSIADALSSLGDTNPYIAFSKYYMQLDHYLEFYPPSRILLLTMEDLYWNRREVLQRVFRFLEVDDSFYTSKFRFMKNVSADISHTSRIAASIKRITDNELVGLIPASLRNALSKVVFAPFRNTASKPELEQSLRLKIIECLKDDVDHLRESTQLNLEKWCL
jgi:hypothetical protein